MPKCRPCLEALLGAVTTAHGRALPDATKSGNLTAITATLDAGAEIEEQEKGGSQNDRSLSLMISPAARTASLRAAFTFVPGELSDGPMTSGDSTIWSASFSRSVTA